MGAVRRGPITAAAPVLSPFQVPPGEKPFPDSSVSAKIRPGVGLTVADDQSAGEGPFPVLLDVHGEPGTTRTIWQMRRCIIQPGPQTDRAIDMIKAFIALQLRTLADGVVEAKGRAPEVYARP
jgi:hypothetical protein